MKSRHALCPEFNPRAPLVVLFCICLLGACSKSKSAQADDSISQQAAPTAVSAGQIYDEALTPDLKERASAFWILPGNRISYITHNGMSDFERQGSYTLESGNVIDVHYDDAPADSTPLRYELKSGMLVSQDDSGHYLLRPPPIKKSVLPSSPEPEPESP